MKYAYDRIVPLDFYTVWEIARYEGINETKMQEYFDNTVAAIRKIAAKENIRTANFKEYWDSDSVDENGNLIGWKHNKSINALSWHSKIEPIAHLFKIFVTKRKAETSDNYVWCVDFGIRKTIYDKWKKTGKIPRLVNNGRMPKYGDKTIAGHRSKVVFPGGGRTNIPQNKQYARFKAGIEKANQQSVHKVSVPETIIAAITEYMDRRQDIFGEPGKPQLDLKRAKKPKTDKLCCTMSLGTKEKLMAFIQRWNDAGNRPLTTEQVVESAVLAYLDAMPHQYSDPELFKAECELKSAQTENKTRGF